MDRSILIKSIINYLSEENKKRNKELCKQNLFSEQKAFDSVDMFFKLAFMPDDELNKIAGLIIK